MGTLSRYLVLPIALCLALVGGEAGAQAVANSDADLSVERPAYRLGAGPVVAIDEGHHNYHTISGRYAPFAAVLKNDGFRVVAHAGPIEPRSLAEVRVLVIANPLAASNVSNWRLPTPSAYEPAEVAALQGWVQDGGALLLIADHMPFAGAANEVARAFGFEFENAYAVKGDGRVPELFSRDARTLTGGPITDGSAEHPAVTEVQSFTGSSFTAPQAAIPLMRLDEDWTLLYPTQAGKFDADTPRRAATRSDLRGAALTYGKGRIVVVSEAAMFTNQLVNGAPFGFGMPSAQQNKRLLLNIVQWLSQTARAPEPAAGSPGGATR